MGKGVALNGERPSLQDKSSLYHIAEVKEKLYTPDLRFADGGLVCRYLSITAGNDCYAHAFYPLHGRLRLTQGSSYRS